MCLSRCKKGKSQIFIPTNFSAFFHFSPTDQAPLEPRSQCTFVFLLSIFSFTEEMVYSKGNSYELIHLITLVQLRRQKQKTNVHCERAI